MATDADVQDTMSTTNDGNIQDVMGDGSYMSLSFSGTPTSGTNTLNVKFTDATTVADVEIQDTMTAS